MYGKQFVVRRYTSEKALIADAKARVPNALEYLVSSYEPVLKVIAKVTRKLDLAGQADGEIEGVAHLAILEAVDRFDPDRGVSFATFIYKRVYGAVLEAVYAHVERRRDEKLNADEEMTRIHFVGLGGDEDVDIYERELYRHDASYGIDPGYMQIETNERDAAIDAFVHELPEPRRAVTRAAFWEGMTHSEIAAGRGVSRPAVTQMIKTALKHGELELADWALAA